MAVDWRAGALIEHSIPDELDPICEVVPLGAGDALIATSTEPGGETRDYHYLMNPLDAQASAEPLTPEPLARDARRLKDAFGQVSFILSDFDGHAGTLNRLERHEEEARYELVPLLEDVHSMGTSFYCPQYLVETAPRDGLVDLDCLDPATGEHLNLVERVAPLNESNELLGVDTLGSWFISPRPRTSRAFVAEVESGRGELHVLAFEERDLVARHEPEETNVWSGSSAMSQVPHAALYLKGRDRALWSYYPDFAQALHIADSVRHYVLLSQPSPAIVYIVEDGDDAGVWLLGSE